MIARTIVPVAAILASMVVAEPASADARLVDPVQRRADVSDPTPLDPALMFDRVVARYQELSAYEDTVVIEQVTARSGERAVRSEVEISCTLNTAGDLDISTPSDAVGGLGRLLAGDPAMNENEDADPGENSEPQTSSLRPSEYELWLAPHMGLRYSKSPLEDFRAGIDEGFTAVKAECVSIENQDVLRLDLQSGDGLSEDYRAKFELFIDPATLLITRIRGIQLLPDGANLLTEFIITPKAVVTAEGENLTPSRVGATT